MPPIHPEIQKLIAVQELDDEIARLRDQLARYPETRKARLAEVESARERLAQARAHALEVEKNLRAEELQIRQWREERNKALAHQFHVKTQKEYEAITHETGELEHKISEADDRGLALLSEEEQAKRQVAECEKTFAAREADCAEEIRRIDEREAEKSAQLEVFLGQRGHATALVESTLLKKYERLGEQHIATRVVPMVDGNCGGCHIRLLAHRLQSLNQPDKINECDSCRRFLYSTKP